MAFPKRGCRTCVQRRIKCDTIEPICGRCAKAKRSCIWDPNEQAGLRFRDESAFAQGKARRPRASKDTPPTTTALVTGTRGTRTTLQPALSISLDDHAFQYWVRTNISELDTLHEAAHEWHSHVIPYWRKANPGSCLHIAVSTLSLAVFGRARRVPQALVQADRSYARCLHKTQEAVSGQAHESMDELLLTTMMMGYFENIRYSTNVSDGAVRKADAVGSRFTNVFCHYEGATGLLRVRREHQGSNDVALDKVARRQIIRASILRGLPVSDWLHEGKEYSESGPALQIDSLMIRVAAFRSRALAFSKEYSELPTSTPDLDHLAHTGKELEDDLVQWADSMFGEWECRKEFLPANNDSSEDSNTHDNYYNTYTSLGHASLWVRQRALRLIINSIFIKFIAIRLRTSSEQAHLLWKQNRMRNSLASISSELCADVPYFITGAPTSNIRNAMTDAVEQEVLPKFASLVAWPLAVAVSTESVPEPQRQWLQQKLRVVADSLGDSVLGQVANRHEFEF